MKKLIYFLAAAAVALLPACSGSKADMTDYEDIGTADTLTFHAELLTIADLGNGTSLVDIADPWAEGKFLGRYVLVDRDSVVPADLPDYYRVIRTPVERAAIYSAVHTGGLSELGALDAVCAIADSAFFLPSDTLRLLARSGAITDVGPAQSPSVEKLAASRAEVILRSPMQGVTAGPVPASATPIECADYMENTPIGRAEWILLLGELTGKRAEARAILDSVIDRYSDLVMKAALMSYLPKVLTETEYSGVWYVPAGGSYSARMLKDAACLYPWDDTEGTGSLALSLEQVADKAMDADIWLIKSYGYNASPETLRKMNPRYASFKAVKEGNVYSCNTAEKPIFNDMAFHPEKILADYVAIFHPAAMPGYELQYFKKAK